MEILGIFAQWKVGGHLINSEQEDGAGIPPGKWLYKNGDGKWPLPQIMQNAPGPHLKSI